MSASPLLTLSGLVRGTLVRRPSERNRSPWVADVRLASGRTVLVHVPSLDMGGKCVEGAELLVAPILGRDGKPRGSGGVGKYGTPQCEFSAQLLRVNEYGGIWVGAHPSLGEKACEALLAGKHLAAAGLSGGVFQRQVVVTAGSRADFVLSRPPPQKRVVIETKTVVDTDYDPSKAPERAQCVFTADPAIPYVRSGIFPWGKKSQHGPDGELVVSARAIKHVDELAAIAKAGKDEACIVFVVIRQDAKSFKPNSAACSSFVDHLRRAQAAGVKLVAVRLRWGEGKDIGKCFFDGFLPVRWPDEPHQGLLDHSAKKRPVAQRDVDGDLPNRPAKRMKGATDEKMKTVPSSRTKTASVTGKGAKSTTVKTTKATTTKTSTKPKPK
jgi:DNA-binding sugar fermentation-stimulating protein